MTFPINERTEWLETDGLGGFSSGTTLGLRTRRYHALLLTATTPPTGRYVLVNGLDVTLVTPEREFALSMQRYLPDVTTPMDGVTLEEFSNDPWPRWVYTTVDGLRIVNDLFVTHRMSRAVMSWRLVDQKPGIRLRVRPLLSGRDYHALHHENNAFQFSPQIDSCSVRWKPYAGVPATRATHTGTYHHHPLWYRGFRYDEEMQRGFDCAEDLASPGVFEFDLSSGEASLALSAELGTDPIGANSVAEAFDQLRTTERQRRSSFRTPLDRAGDAYIVKRQQGRSIIAGYPWFADWGRDTFISLRGLCLGTGRVDDARDILLAWCGMDSEGVMPNRFPDDGGVPEYNSVDAALWFIIAAHETIETASMAGRPLSPHELATFHDTIQRVLHAYAKGTRHGIRMDDDGLLAAGVPGQQLTWMDAKVGSRVITPRIGKPVEVQALWLNALRIGAMKDRRWQQDFERGMESFASKFWNEAEGCLYDVVDADHIPGACDASVRPNQVIAVGGLPFSVLYGPRAKQVVDAVESRLWTPLGLRSLAPGQPGYRGVYQGGPEQRDEAYHQGTIWPWLIGAFVHAWIKTHGDTARSRKEARQRFLAPLVAHLNVAGIGHVSEIADADPPHRPAGCPFQAWSIGEVLRLDRIILAEPTQAESRAERTRQRSPIVLPAGTRVSHA